MPDEHMLVAQQPPWQVWVIEHMVVHAFEPHDSPIGQSVVALVQPHMPPPPVATHAVPFELPAQLAQAPPVAPQLAATVPLAQLVPSQQPVLQASPPVQPVWQVPPVPVHARCSGQSVARLQPQLPPFALAMHSTPLAGEVTQLVQAPPFEPHLATAVPTMQVVPPSQQPPLQVSPPAH
jgi:hypothetical protein